MEIYLDWAYAYADKENKFIQILLVLDTKIEK